MKTLKYFQKLKSNFYYWYKLYKLFFWSTILIISELIFIIPIMIFQSKDNVKKEILDPLITFNNIFLSFSTLLFSFSLGQYVVKKKDNYYFILNHIDDIEKYYFKLKEIDELGKQFLSENNYENMSLFFTALIFMFSKTFLFLHAKDNQVYSKQSILWIKKVLNDALTKYKNSDLLSKKLIKISKKNINNIASIFYAETNSNMSADFLLDFYNNYKTIYGWENFDNKILELLLRIYSYFINLKDNDYIKAIYQRIKEIIKTTKIVRGKTIGYISKCKKHKHWNNERNYYCSKTIYKIKSLVKSIKFI